MTQAIGMGKPETARELWQQAEAVYERADDSLGMVGAQLNQAQALQTMGLYHRAHLGLMKRLTLKTLTLEALIEAIEQIILLWKCWDSGADTFYANNYSGVLCSRYCSFD